MIVTQVTLAEQAMLLRSELHDCLAMIESFLVIAGAALDTHPIAAEASSPTELNVTEVREEGPFGSFSPRAMSSTLSQPDVPVESESEVMAPVMLIMPELEKLCGESATPLSEVHLELDLPGHSVGATKGEALATDVPPVLEIMPELQELCESPALPLAVEHVKVDSPMTLSSPERSDVVSAPVAPLLTLSPDALFAKELCDVLSKLEAAIPGCGRAIAYLLTRTAVKGNDKKVNDCPRKEKSLKGKHKKSGAIGTMSAAP
jgi:hypothetical protein